MTTLPDRLTQDLRRKEREERDAEFEARASAAARLDEALCAIREPERLRQLLSDEALARPLARLMQNLEDFGVQLTGLKVEHACGDDEVSAIESSAKAVAEIERLLVAWQMEKSC